MTALQPDGTPEKPRTKQITGFGYMVLIAAAEQGMNTTSLLAEALGVHSATVAQLIYGQMRPTPDLLTKLSKVTQLSVDQLRIAAGIPQPPKLLTDQPEVVQKLAAALERGSPLNAVAQALLASTVDSLVERRVADVGGWGPREVSVTVELEAHQAMVEARRELLGWPNPDTSPEAEQRRQAARREAEEQLRSFYGEPAA